MEIYIFSFKFFLKFVPNGPNNNETALVQREVWGWTGDKLLSEPMMTYFTIPYVRLIIDELTTTCEVPMANNVKKIFLKKVRVPCLLEIPEHASDTSELILN